MNRQELEKKLKLPGEDAIEILTSLRKKCKIRANYNFGYNSVEIEECLSGNGWETLFWFSLEKENPKFSRNYITINELAEKILEKILQEKEVQEILTEILE